MQSTLLLSNFISFRCKFLCSITIMPGTSKAKKGQYREMVNWPPFFQPLRSYMRKTSKAKKGQYQYLEMVNWPPFSTFWGPSCQGQEKQTRNSILRCLFGLHFFILCDNSIFMAGAKRDSILRMRWFIDPSFLQLHRIMISVLVQKTTIRALIKTGMYAKSNPAVLSLGVPITSA